jgi:hypothetical protein
MGHGQELRKWLRHVSMPSTKVNCLQPVMLIITLPTCGQVSWWAMHGEPILHGCGMSLRRGCLAWGSYKHWVIHTGARSGNVLNGIWPCTQWCLTALTGACIKWNIVFLNGCPGQAMYRTAYCVPAVRLSRSGHVPSGILRTLPAVQVRPCTERHLAYPYCCPGQAMYRAASCVPLLLSRSGHVPSGILRTLTAGQVRPCTEWYLARSCTEWCLMVCTKWHVLSGIVPLPHITTRSNSAPKLEPGTSAWRWHRRLGTLGLTAPEPNVPNDDKHPLSHRLFCIKTACAKTEGHRLAGLQDRLISSSAIACTGGVIFCENSLFPCHKDR